MDYPRKPALLFYRLVRLLSSSLDWSAWVPCCLLYALPNEDLENL
jgi:hypothetical protein